ncbi:MAG: LysR family transcriptional regulator [Psychromonas sp.]
MKAKDISNLYWFCQSVKYGGFAAASLQTNVSAPTLSRAVSYLEDKLGEKLVHRNAKQFQLTSAGEEYYQRFAITFGQLDEQWIQLSNSQPTLVGDINTSCPEPFADYFLQQIAIEFMSLHPDVNIHIKFSSDTQRFFDDHIDLAVVTTPSKTSNLVQRQLFNSQLVLAAAPSYLAKYGRPNQVQQLLEHKLIIGNTMPFWEFKQGNEMVRVPLNAKYSINSIRLSIQAACSGLGVCLLPAATLNTYIKQGQLEPILTDVHCSSGKAFLVWSDRKLISARVSAFRDMIFARMENSDDLFSNIGQG